MPDAAANHGLAGRVPYCCGRDCQKITHTVVIATHDLELVVELCSRAILLDGGSVVADGPTGALLGDEELMLAHGLESPHILQHRHPH